MGKAVVKVSSLHRAGLMCCGVGAVVACSTAGRNDAPLPIDAPSQQPASASAPAGASVLYTFRGEASVAKRTITIAYAAPNAGAITPQYQQLPEGPGASHVVVHTVPGSVIWDTTNTAGCGGTLGDPHLCGMVNIVNDFPVAVSETTAQFTTITASTVHAVGAPYVYGSIAGSGGQSGNIEWVFDDPNSTDFSFLGTVYGTPAGTDAGIDSGSPCGTCVSPTPLCNTTSSTCVQCLHTSDCTSGLVCSPSDQCVQCVNNTECAAGQVCNGSNQCVSACGTCTAPTPFCNAGLATCVQCLSNSECASGQNCNASGQCVSVCGTCSPATPFCNTVSATCQQCLTNSECAVGNVCNPSGQCVSVCGTCSGATPFCNVESATCQQCLNNSECPSGDSCEAGTCTSPSPCGSCEAPTPYCSTSSNECVECLYDVNCIDIGASYCINNECF